MNAGGDAVDGRALKDISFLAGCTEAQLRTLAGFCRARSFRRYACLQEEGAPSQYVSFLLRGEVALQQEVGADAEPARLSIVRSGEMFGFGEAFLRNYYTTAVAMSAVTVARVTNKDFRNEFLALRILRDRLFLSLSEITRILVHKVVAGGGLNDLALYLRHLARQNGKVVGRRVHLQHEVRQPEVASILNLSREHVTRLFAQLRKQGVVSFNRGYPIIDRAWLDRMTRDRDLADSLQFRDVTRPPQ